MKKAFLNQKIKGEGGGGVGRKPKAFVKKKTAVIRVSVIRSF